MINPHESHECMPCVILLLRSIAVAYLARVESGLMHVIFRELTCLFPLCPFTSTHTLTAGHARVCVLDLSFSLFCVAFRIRIKRPGKMLFRSLHIEDWPVTIYARQLLPAIQTAVCRQSTCATVL